MVVMTMLCTHTWHAEEQSAHASMPLRIGRIGQIGRGSINVESKRFVYSLGRGVAHASTHLLARNPQLLALPLFRVVGLGVDALPQDASIDHIALVTQTLFVLQFRCQTKQVF